MLKVDVVVVVAGVVAAARVTVVVSGSKAYQNVEFKIFRLTVPALQGSRLWACDVAQAARIAKLSPRKALSN